jgi:hypothetical protein
MLLKTTVRSAFCSAVSWSISALQSTSRTATPCSPPAPPRRVLNVTHRYAARQATAKASCARERSACAAAGSPSGRQSRARTRASADASGRPVSDGRFGVFVCLFVCLLVRSLVRSFVRGCAPPPLTLVRGCSWACRRIRTLCPFGGAAPPPRRPVHQPSRRARRR